MDIRVDLRNLTIITLSLHHWRPRSFTKRPSQWSLTPPRLYFKAGREQDRGSASEAYRADRDHHYRALDRPKCKIRPAHPSLSKGIILPQVRSQNSKSRQGKNTNPKTEGVAINGQSICFGMSNDLRLLLPYAGQSTCTSTSFCQSRARTAFRRNSGSSISERWGLRLDNPSKRRYQVRLARV